MSRRKRGAAPGTDRFADAPLDGSLLEVDEVKTQFKTPRGLVHAVGQLGENFQRGAQPVGTIDAIKIAGEFQGLRLADFLFHGAKQLFGLVFLGKSWQGQSQQTWR